MVVDPNNPNAREIANYTWLADGTKAQVVDQDDNGYVYLGSLIYKQLPDSTLELESTNHGSGRIVVKDNPAPPGEKLYENQYHITDHLGSVRTVFNQNGEVMARNDFYPFGKPHNNPTLMSGLTNPANPQTNRFLFNGKEKQLFGSLGLLDYGWRMHDPEIGRWFSPDPLAEQYTSHSPYSFTGNNPIRFIDFDGRKWGTEDDKEFAETANSALKGAKETKEKTQIRLENKIARRESKGKNTSKQQERLANVKEEIKTLDAAIDEIKTMGEDESTTFTFKFVSSGSGSANYVGDNTIEMTVVTGSYKTANGIHELSHGFDIFNGMNMGDAEQRIASEVKAYQRQYAYEPGSMPTSYYGSLTGISDIGQFWVGGIYDTNYNYMYAKYFPVLQNRNNKQIEEQLDLFKAGRLK